MFGFMFSAFDLMEIAVLIWKVEFVVCVNFACDAHFYHALFKAMGVSMSYVDLNNSRSSELENRG